MDEYEKRLAEYKEALSTSRFHNTILFGELTVYIAASGSLLKYAISKEDFLILPQYQILVAIIGLILSIAFLIISERSLDYLKHAREKAKSLENNLSFSLVSSRPKSKGIITAINATRCIYIIGFILWFFIIFESRSNFSISEHWILRLLLSCSYILIILGSLGMVVFASKFPFSTRIKDLKLVDEKFLNLNGYQVWMLSWSFIIIGTFMQLVAVWAN